MTGSERIDSICVLLLYDNLLVSICLYVHSRGCKMWLGLLKACVCKQAMWRCGASTPQLPQLVVEVPQRLHFSAGCGSPLWCELLGRGRHSTATTPAPTVAQQPVAAAGCYQLVVAFSRTASGAPFKGPVAGSCKQFRMPNRHCP